MLKLSALVLGYTGQNGSYLAKQFLVKGYETSEIILFTPAITLKFLNHIHRDTRDANLKLTLSDEDLVDGKNLNDLARIFDPIDITA